MSVKNRDYDMRLLNKAVNLIMLGEQMKGNELLRQLCDGQPDAALKDLALSIMNKNKKELLERIEYQQSVTGSSDAIVK